MNILIITRDPTVLTNKAVPALRDSVRIWARSPGRIVNALCGVALDHVIYDVPISELTEEERAAIRPCLAASLAKRFNLETADV